MIFIHDVKIAYFKHYQVLSGRGVKHKFMSQKYMSQKYMSQGYLAGLKYV